MLLLSADTSGQHGSIALAQCQPDGGCEILEVLPLAGGTFSAQLVPQIAALLAKYHFSKANLDGFAVASGPGSFTGLRVGLAAVKALAEVLRKPIAAVSLLEAISVAANVQGRLFSALDAGRNEVYLGEYDISGPNAQLVSERLLSRDAAAEEVRGLMVATTERPTAELLARHALEVRHITTPASELVARIGWNKILAGSTVSSFDLDANYIRRSDAEIFSKPLSS